MDQVNNDYTIENYGHGEFHHPSHQSSNDHDAIEALQKEVDEEDKVNRKQNMDYKRVSDYNLEIIQQLNAALEICHKQCDEREMACAAAWKEIEKMKNKNLALQEICEKFKKKQDELDFETSATDEKCDNPITELTSEVEHLWEGSVKAFGIDQHDWDELRLETEYFKRMIAIGKARIDGIQTLEYVEEMSYDGDLPTTVSIGNNLSSATESCKEMCQELIEMKISDD